MIFIIGFPGIQSHTVLGIFKECSEFTLLVSLRQKAPVVGKLKISRCDMQIGRDAYVTFYELQ